MQHALLKEERERLKIQHKQERDKRVCDRIKAVLLRDEGWTHEQIAHVLLLTDAAVRQHISVNVIPRAAKNLDLEQRGV